MFQWMSTHFTATRMTTGLPYCVFYFNNAKVEYFQWQLGTGAYNFSITDTISQYLCQHQQRILACTTDEINIFENYDNRKTVKYLDEVSKITLLQIVLVFSYLSRPFQNFIFKKYPSATTLIPLGPAYFGPTGNLSGHFTTLNHNHVLLQYLKMFQNKPLYWFQMMQNW